MPQIHPVSDLRNKSGGDDMVVMSAEAHERKQFESEIYFKLKEVELQAKTTNQRFAHEEVFSSLRNGLAEKMNDNH